MNYDDYHSFQGGHLPHEEAGERFKKQAQKDDLVAYGLIAINILLIGALIGLAAHLALTPPSDAKCRSGSSECHRMAR